MRQDILGRDIQLGGPLSFVYIDGNHQYDFAKETFTMPIDSLMSAASFSLMTRQTFRMAS